MQETEKPKPIDPYERYGEQLYDEIIKDRDFIKRELDDLESRIGKLKDHHDYLNRLADGVKQADNRPKETPANIPAAVHRGC